MTDSNVPPDRIVVADKTFIPFIPADAVQRRVRELAAEISRDHADREPLLVCVLNGAFLFFADLVRNMRIEHTQDFLRPASYGDGMKSSGTVELRKDLETDIRGRHVILVEDIVDTGRTLDFLLRMLRERAPASLAVATLLHKPAQAVVAHDLAYVGFEIPPAFVVGYGLDYGQRARHLEAIYTLAPENGGRTASDSA